MGGLDQNVLGVPSTDFGTTGEVQDALVYNAPNASTAYFTADLTAQYNGTWVESIFTRVCVLKLNPSVCRSAKRAIRFLNGRKQILLQDEITVPTAGVQW